MSWIQELYETYETSITNPEFSTSEKPLLPTEHTLKQAHIEIYINKNGEFLKNRAKVVPKLETIIPATEKSSTRTTNDAPHPLCDKVQYCAKDYASYGGSKEPYFNSYFAQLERWCNSEFSHPKIKAVFKYISRGTVVTDLAAEKILQVDEFNKLINEWKSDLAKPDIFKYVNNQGDAFIRWVIETPGNPLSECWKDFSLFKAWSGFISSQETHKGLCMVSGRESPLAEKHPARIRHSADGSKLISSNDLNGYTFLGRFLSAREAAGISTEVTQKAHSALRWLIGRKQAFKNGDQVIVSWEVSGVDIPDFLNTFDIFAEENEPSNPPEKFQGDVGQGFARRLSKYIAGYSLKLGPTTKIVVLGLDSASPGRLAITFYRELTGSEFLQRIEFWYNSLAWLQRVFVEDKTQKKEKLLIWRICTPVPKDIALAAYGTRLDDKLKKATVERLLPCIIDGLPIPRDIVDSTFRRACNRPGFEHWEWEKVLGIACSLFKGYYSRNSKEKRSYSMALESERKTRDYLFGRLLAAADGLEKYALNLEKAGKNEDTRQTNAARFMQHFAIKPSSTWKTIELSLRPYIGKLGNRANKYCNTITEVTNSFEHDDYVADKPLSPEFLLGYHCQRQAYFDNFKKAPDEIEPITETENS